jgi:hypothetical protein
MGMALNKLFQGILAGATKSVPSRAALAEQQAISDFVARARMQDPSFYRGKSQKELRALFEKLFAREENRLFRNNYGPDVKTRFSERKQLRSLYDEEGNMAATGEPGGIYWATEERDLAPLIGGFGRNPGMPDEIWNSADQLAAILPHARQRTFSREEWSALKDVPKKRLTQDLKKDFDIIDVPDIAIDLWPGETHIRQKIQLNPKQVVTKIGDKYKILGAAGLTAGAALSPDEAEAGLLGKAVSGTWKLFKDAMGARSGKVAEEMRKIGQKSPAISGAHERLKGAPLKDGIVSGVYQGGGDKRFIHMEDGRIFPVDTKTLGEIVSEWQTKKYADKFRAMPGAVSATEQSGAQWDAIMKSYQRNEKIALPASLGGAKPTKQQQYEYFMQNREKDFTAGTMEDQVLVQSTKSKKYWMWPKVYAEPAEAAGLVKIDKTGWTPYKVEKK